MAEPNRPPLDALAAATLRWLDEHAAAGVITTDLDLIIRSWNKWIADATDLPAATVIGRPLFEGVPSLVERGLDADFQEALDGQIKILSHTLHRYVVPCERAGGELMPQIGRIAPLVDGERVIGTIVTVQDVGDRIATERQWRTQITVAEDAQRQAENASRAKDEFLATLSHEIRTPLSAVLGWVHLLRAREPDVVTMKRAIDVIERNAQSQLALINDMLDMARISSGKVRLELTDVNLVSVVASAVDAVRPTADVKGVRLVTDLPAGVVAVSGDADRLLQIVWNLLSNAVKFTGSGGLVVVALRADNKGAHLTVADTGQGIDRKFLPQVFDRFKQADTSAARRSGGLGLGLALVKDLVTLHGGSVGVESPGTDLGSTFSVHLPHPITLAAPAAPKAEAMPAAVLDGLCVLIVEDDPDARDIAARTITDAGGQSVVAANAMEALNALTTGGLQLDALISDIGLPGTDGYSLLDAVRGLPNGRRGIPAIAVTAYASEDDARRALTRGFVAHISKPYVPSTLIAAVRSAVDNRPARLG